jgi:hypothetical protein
MRLKHIYVMVKPVVLARPTLKAICKETGIDYKLVVRQQWPIKNNMIEIYRLLLYPPDDD